MDLDEAAALLYAGSPDDFVSRRTTLAGQARAQQDRELARAIGALRRPTRSAWLVNLLAQEAAAELSALLELGDALREAQAHLAGADLRRLSAERSRAVAALARRAVALGAEQGYAAGDAALQEVSSTLQAALADPDVADAVRAGRVALAVSYGGFGPMTWPVSPSAPPPAAESSGPELDSVAADEPDARSEAASAEAERQRAEAQAAEAERERRHAKVQAAEAAARQVLEEAEAAALAATVRADELADTLEELRRQVRDTEAAEREAREEARAARKRVTPAREVAARARAHLDAAGREGS